MLIKFIHITVVISLLTSSVGVVINQHFCQGELKHTTVFAAAKTCHAPTDTQQPACPYHHQPEQEKGLEQRDCCEDSSQYLKSSKEQQVEQQELNIWCSFSAVSTFFSPEGNGQPVVISAAVPSTRPPPRFTEYAVQFQIFRL